MNWRFAKILLFLIGSFFSPMLSNAQNHCFKTQYSSFSIPDSIIIVPATIKVKNSKNEDFPYELHHDYLKIQRGNYTGELEVCYNYVSVKKSIVETAVPEKLFDSSAIFTDYKVPISIGNKSNQELLGLGALNISGAFMRSVSAGRQQSTMMHSVMDLTISGAISDELDVKARLTDQQLPFEPEGNTQRLQDFDRVNIQLIHNDWAVEAGDLNLRPTKTFNFLKYNRQVQGIGLSTSKLSIDSTNSNTELVVSFARSKAGVQNIEPIEGVLGPYRIEGPQNEPFIFILAGSETVYLDGEKLERGLENDYIIDYNAAEITFNSHLYLSKYSVIQIEFEYSDRQYDRTVTNFQHNQKIGNLDINVGYFQQKDKPGNQINTFSEYDFQQLSNISGINSYGEIQAIDSIGFQEGQINYAKIDTTLSGKKYSIYRYSKDPRSAHYNLIFTQVGQNNGNYIISNTSINGVVYEWVAPIDDIPQGNYEPVKRVALPQNQRIIDVGLTYNLNNGSTVGLEYAGSEFVSNQFNSEASQQKGNALKLSYTSDNKELNFLKEVYINNYISYEYLDSTFSPIQPFREMDFNRNWGLQESAVYLAGEEHLINLGTEISTERQLANYSITFRDKENAGQGIQQKIRYHRKGDLQITANVFVMDNHVEAKNISWRKALFDINFTQYELIPGYTFNTQQHQIWQNEIIEQSFQYFNSHQFYLKKIDSSAWSFLLSHELRQDDIPFEEKMIRNEDAQNTKLETSFQFNEGNRLSLNAINRNIVQKNDSNNQQHYLQGGINWLSSLLDGHINQNINFQTGTGRVLERNYFFMEVARNLGTHSWSDLNNNGEKELNEFFEDETEYGNRNYVKVLTMGSDYKTAYINRLLYQLQWKMPESWRDSDGLLYYFGKLSGNFNANFDSKNTFENWLDRISPLSNTENEKVLSSRNIWKSSFYYNRGGDLNFESTWSSSNRKQLLLDGFEGMSRKNYLFSTSLNTFQDWNVNLSYLNSISTSFSDRVDERDYAFTSQSIIPKIMWQNGKKLRLVLAYKNNNKWSEHEAFGGSVNVNSIELSNKFIQSQNDIFESKVSYVSVDSKLKDNQSPLAFEMFEGLQAGDNYVWNISMKRKLIGDLNLILQYIGRKSKDYPVIHNGSVQLTALF
ncbi:hypothetical protein [Marivirga arenosa]|uniref:Cell surface protein SprA n=1 Tax=Marivirga arenosa TaxID=3059076 RepID=A0AA52EXL7_9BACT|nr:hypothetical protein [Marivirga sp. BKB1-2]WNB18515.1 hypothetical protein QYS47_30430 [Marivirga sp. BKB1-2]